MSTTAAFIRLENALESLEHLIATLPPPPPSATAIEEEREAHESLKSRHALLRSRAEAALEELDRLLGRGAAGGS